MAVLFLAAMLSLSCRGTLALKSKVGAAKTNQAAQSPPAAATPTPVVTPAPTPSPVESGAAAGGEETRPGNPEAWGENARMSVGRNFDPVYFDRDSSDLNFAARRRLQEYADWLRSRPAVWVTLAGYTDTLGTREYNYNLGMERALAVKDFLAGLGIEPYRLYGISYGEDDPADEAGTPEAMALNRRVEFMAFVAPIGQEKPAPVKVTPGGAPEAGKPSEPPKAKDLKRGK